MRLITSFGKLLAFSAVFLVPPADAESGSSIEKKIIERTKSTSATYSAFFWNRITRPNQPAVEEWSAEFHDGNHHRVETPRDRIIANCNTNTGTYLSVASGELISGANVAAAACGINTNGQIVYGECGNEIWKGSTYSNCR